jgi:hypothetical protein
MSFIKLSSIYASPASINNGDSLTLSYSISGDDDAQLEITYSLDSAYNIYFVLPDGQTTQMLPVERMVLDTPPMLVTKGVSICKKSPLPGKDDYNYFDIKVSVADNTTSDSGNCNITIT